MTAVKFLSEGEEPSKKRKKLSVSYFKVTLRRFYAI